MVSPGRTLVVGASGFLGSKVTEGLRAAGVDVVGTAFDGTVPVTGVETVRYDFWEDDLERILDETIDRVVLAATVETDHDRSLETFTQAVDRFVDACGDRRIVYVSTDAVFDGEAGRYDEHARPSPTDEYGRRGRLFERRIEGRCPDHCIVRVSYLYGFSKGGLDPRLARTRSRIRAGETVAYFEDAYKSPIAVSDAAEVIARLTRADTTGVVHAAAPRSSIHEFHRTAMAALGEPTERVVPEPVPSGIDYPHDTSLVSARGGVIEFEPRSVRAVLEGRGP